MSNEVRILIKNLEEEFKGNPWYGGSLIEKLNSIDFTITNFAPTPSKNSVARLVQHIINWRIFTIKKLKGDVDFDIKLNDASDWSDIHIDTKSDWKNLIERLKDTQKEIIKLLVDKPDDFLTTKVPGKKYNYRFLIDGIAQHDIYHFGQIVLVAKLSEENKNDSPKN
jgi:uncharacterized damage-inducible protein DinB